MKLVAKDTPLNYSVKFSEINELKVCINYIM